MQNWRFYPWTSLAAVLLLCLSVAAEAQTAPAEEVQVRQRLDRLIEAVDAVHRQMETSQLQMRELSSQIADLRRQLDAKAGTETADALPADKLSNAVEELKEQSELQQAEIKVHDQTKVESASKYPIRISGMLLFSSFLNNGAVDNVDSPSVALSSAPPASNGSLAATLRHTVLGIDATGPHLWGAGSRADLTVDFFGDLSYSGYSTSVGALRLRTAHVALDWARGAAIFSLDRPLISPLRPASLLGQAVPALSWSGNLWAWSPQFEVTRRQALGPGNATAQIGIIDPYSSNSISVSGSRQPSPSETSRQPGYEARLGYSFGGEGRPISVGIGGFSSRQKFAYGQRVDSWAATADYSVPLGRFFEVTGELYRGRALAALGGGVYKDYYTDSKGAIHGLNAEGGWTQLKFIPVPRLETNASIGLDDGFASDLQYAAPSALSNPYLNLARNRTVLGNMIFRPRTYLSFSTEYRFIESWPSAGASSRAQSLGLAAGYIF